MSGKVRSTNLRQIVSATSFVQTTSTSFVDLDGMSITVTGSGLPVVISAHIGGVYNNSNGGGLDTYFQLVVDGTPVASAMTETTVNSVAHVALQWVTTLSTASHAIKVQWKAQNGTSNAGYTSVTRSIVVFE